LGIQDHLPLHSCPGINILTLHGGDKE